MRKCDFWTDDEGAAIVSAWRREGMTHEDIAEKIGVKARTLAAWERSSEKLGKALAESREQADAKVEAALLKKALGFKTTEKKYVVKPDGKEEVTTVTKEVPPDAAAASVWLKNRRPDKWRDKPEADNGTEQKLDEILRGIENEADG